jgi:hypothetical protein
MWRRAAPTGNSAGDPPMVSGTARQSWTPNTPMRSVDAPEPVLTNSSGTPSVSRSRRPSISPPTTGSSHSELGGGAVVGAAAGDGRPAGTAPPVGPVVAAAVDGDDSDPGSSPGSSLGASVGAPVATASVWLSPPATTTIPITATAATTAAINSQAFPVNRPTMSRPPNLRPFRALD